MFAIDNLRAYSDDFWEQFRNKSNVFETIKNEADRYGVSVIGSEIIGLLPLEALVDVSNHYLRLEKFTVDQVLEKRLLEIKQ